MRPLRLEDRTNLSLSEVGVAWFPLLSLAATIAYVLLRAFSGHSLKDCAPERATASELVSILHSGVFWSFGGCIPDPTGVVSGRSRGLLQLKRLRPAQRSRPLRRASFLVRSGRGIL